MPPPPTKILPAFLQISSGTYAEPTLSTKSLWLSVGAEETAFLGGPAVVGGWHVTGAADEARLDRGAWQMAWSWGAGLVLRDDSSAFCPELDRTHWHLPQPCTMSEAPAPSAVPAPPALPRGGGGWGWLNASVLHTEFPQHGYSRTVILAKGDVKL